MLAPDDHHKISELVNLELRHVEASKLTRLSAILDKAQAWKKLVEQLTKPLPNNSQYNLKLSLDDINVIEQQVYCEKSPTLALLNHWAITGRRRPTVGVLLHYLHICNLKWAEDYVLQSLLGIKSIDIRQPPEIVEARTSSIFDINDQFKFDNLDHLVNELETECVRYSFKSIYKTTNGFCHKPYNRADKSGAKIGEGRFSSVFRAQTQPESSYTNGQQQIVAAKLLKSECNSKYLVNEINLVGKIEHENILGLLGISLGESADGCMRYICLLYHYMHNGSLLDCLSLGVPTRNMEHLTWDIRIGIAIKVARGISYLHTFPEGPIIHRDIKTANIFIDDDLEPKVGDFTLVRQLESHRATETQFSQNVIGTSVYMPPEAFRGDISIKFDSFSFGIVILELLTGMRPFKEDLDEDLLTFINEKMSDIDDNIFPSTTKEETQSMKMQTETAKESFLEEILDKKAGGWDFKSSKILFNIALQATESRKKNRPEISNLLPSLEAIKPDE